MPVFVTFDLDGTLGDFSRAHSYAFLKAVPEIYNEIYVSWPDISSSGLTDLQIIVNFLQNHGLGMDEIFSKINQCQTRMTEIFEKSLPQYPIKLIDGVTEALDVLSSHGVLMGLVTGNIEKIAWKKAENTGISHYFDLGSFGTHVFNRTGVLKRGVENAIKQFGLSTDDLIFHVGDTTSDIRAAIEVGVIPIGVTTGWDNEEMLRNAGAHMVINNLKALPLLIQNFVKPIAERTIPSLINL